MAPRRPWAPTVSEQRGPPPVSSLVLAVIFGLIVTIFASVLLILVIYYPYPCSCYVPDSLNDYSSLSLNNVTHLEHWNEPTQATRLTGLLALREHEAAGDCQVTLDSTCGGPTQLALHSQPEGVHIADFGSAGSFPFTTLYGTVTFLGQGSGTNGTVLIPGANHETQQVSSVEAWTVLRGLIPRENGIESVSNDLQGKVGHEEYIVLERLLPYILRALQSLEPSP